MNPALDWLNGKSLANVEKKDFTWFFNFKQGSLVQTNSFWRLIASERLVVASDDHGQLFGLKEPIDAVHLVTSTIGHRAIIQYSLSDVNDLILDFGDKIKLQFLTTSGGYESWETGNRDFRIICAGGGRLSKFNLVGNTWVRSPQ